MVITPPGAPTKVRSLVVSPEGRVQLILQAPSGQRFVIQASSDLDSWEDLGTVDSDETPVEFVDPAAVNHLRRFYRAKPIP